MVKKLFPEFKQNISVAMTPMVLTARFVKKQHPGCKVVFVGPCDAKKLEASRKTVRSDVDFVLTFEEVPGMCAAKGIDKECIPMSEAEPLKQSGKDARMFAVSGGVAQAVVNAIKSMDPEREVKVAKAAGLDECRKLLLMAKAGKYDGYLLERLHLGGNRAVVVLKAPEGKIEYFTDRSGEHRKLGDGVRRKRKVLVAQLLGGFERVDGVVRDALLWTM